MALLSFAGLSVSDCIAMINPDQAAAYQIAVAMTKIITNAPVQAYSNDAFAEVRRQYDVKRPETGSDALRSFVFTLLRGSSWADVVRFFHQLQSFDTEDVDQMDNAVKLMFWIEDVVNAAVTQVHPTHPKAVEALSKILTAEEDIQKAHSVELVRRLVVSAPSFDIDLVIQALLDIKKTTDDMVHGGFDAVGDDEGKC